MSQLSLLNNVTHADLKVDTQLKAAHGDAVNCVVAFPTEFADLQREFPILFQKMPESNQYQAVVLMGLSQDENLFLVDDQWLAAYVPAMLARGPFSIGFQDQTAQGGSDKALVVMVDENHPKVSDSGTNVFTDVGGNSPYLQHINQVLSLIYQGMSVAESMYAAFDKAGLIEPVRLDFRLSDGQQHQVSGYYTINREKLAGLNPNALHELNQAGFLEGAFLIANSLNNMQKLIDRKNQSI